MVHAAQSVLLVQHAESEADLLNARELFIESFRWMLLARALDEKMASLYRAGQIHGGVFLGRGQEALSASIGQQLGPNDVFAPLIRDLAGRLAAGQEILDVVRNHLGSRLGPTRGRDGNVHHGRPKQGLLHMVSHLGAMIAAVNGVLLARRFQGVKGLAGVASVGDGATSTGAFHEALNQAAIEKLPLVLVIANNQYAYSTPNARQFACETLLDKAVGYGVEGRAVDGVDLAACLEVVGRALERARSGGGPQLVVARLLRLCGHGEHDDAGYIDPKLRQSQWGRDCLQVAEETLGRHGWADRDTIALWRTEALRQVEDAVLKVQREPAPDPYEERWCSLASRQFNEGQQQQD